MAATAPARRQVFVPTTLTRLRRWCEIGELAAAGDADELTAVAVTAEFAAAFGRAEAGVDDEELLLEALADAAELSQRLPREAGEPEVAVVLAVEAAVAERPGTGGLVRLRAPVPRAAWIAAYREPDGGGGRPDPAELAWYAVQELPDALA